jgi:uncharacterized membrane protein YphA (DoxX/SURF4 family)
MFQSLHRSQLSLRIGLAAVFVWFGIDKFIQPQYWVDAWTPQFAQALAAKAGLAATDLMYFIAILEVLVALSLATGFFMQWFAAGAAAFLAVVFAVHGVNEVLVRDIGLIGGLVALVLWPERSYI